MIISSLSWASLISAPSFKISGAQRAVLENVEKRLNELTKYEALNKISNDELRQHVLKAVQPFGYFSAKADIYKNHQGMLSIILYPGVRTYISSLRVEIIGEGSKQPKLVKILNHLPIKVGQPLITEKYDQLKQKLINMAERLGYLRASFPTANILIDQQNAKADITLIFNTGPLFYFGEISFDSTTISPELLKRYVPFHPNQPYSTHELIQFNNALSDSGYFNSVIAKPIITDSQVVPIEVHLEPVSKYAYTIGGGYGTDTGIRGRAGLHLTPVNRQGHQFNAMAQGSFVQNALQAQYLIPGNNPITDQYNITGNFSNLNYNAGDANALLLSLAQEYKSSSFTRTLSVNALSEHFNYWDLPKTYQRALYPKALVTFIKKDNLLFSPSGYNITVAGLAASRTLLSELDFFQTSLDIKAAYMIEPLRLRVYGHTIQGITSTKNIYQFPLSLALLLGGADNLKGYSFNSIGPGKKILYGGLELQKETISNIYVVGFFDSGAVYDPTPKNTLYDAGAGLMWVSPIGPIKIGLAQPITPQFKRTTPRPQIVISMGPSL